MKDKTRLRSRHKSPREADLQFYLDTIIISLSLFLLFSYAKFPFLYLYALWIFFARAKCKRVFSRSKSIFDFVPFPRAVYLVRFIYFQYYYFSPLHLFSCLESENFGGKCSRGRFHSPNLYVRRETWCSLHSRLYCLRSAWGALFPPS